MHTAPKPIFLFLLPVQGCSLPDQDPFLAVVSTNGVYDGCVVDAEGTLAPIGGNTWTDVGTALAAKGIRNADALQMGMGFDPLADCFVEGLSSVLLTIAAEGTDTDELDASMPDTHDVFEEGAIARTRDAAFWLTNGRYGHRPPIEMGAYIDPLMGIELPDDVSEGMEQALAAHLPDGIGSYDLEDLLDFFMVGVVANPTSAHAQLAQRGRVAEDVRLLAHVWAQTGEAQRPVIPIFF
jgi:hypothetical protein